MECPQCHAVFADDNPNECPECHQWYRFGKWVECDGLTKREHRLIDLEMDLRAVRAVTVAALITVVGWRVLRR
jgi:hypothetical protein